MGNFEPKFECHPYKEEIIKRLTVDGENPNSVERWLRELSVRENNPKLLISSMTLRAKMDMALKTNTKQTILNVVKSTADLKIKQLWKTIESADKLIVDCLKSNKKLKIESIKDLQAVASIKRDALDLINKLEGNTGADTDVAKFISELTQELLKEKPVSQIGEPLESIDVTKIDEPIAT